MSAARPAKLVVTVVDGDRGVRVPDALVRLWYRSSRTDAHGVAEIRVPDRRDMSVTVGASGFGTRTLFEPFAAHRRITVRIYRPSLQWPMYGATPSRSQSQVHIHLRPPFRTVWWVPLGGLVEFPAVVDEGVAYVGNRDATIHAISMRFGRVLWKHLTPHGKMASSPAVYGSDLVYHSMDGHVFVLRRSDGSVLWSYSVGSPIESSPIVRDGVDYFGTWDGRLLALDLRAHRLRWGRDLGAKITSSAAIAGDTLYIGDYAGRLWAISPETGATKWTASVNGRIYGTPAVAGGRVFVPSSTGDSLTAFSTSGGYLWRVDTGSYVYSSPAAWGGRCSSARTTASSTASRPRTAAGCGKSGPAGRSPAPPSSWTASPTRVASRGASSGSTRAAGTSCSRSTTATTCPSPATASACSSTATRACTRSSPCVLRTSRPRAATRPMLRERTRWTTPTAGATLEDESPLVTVCMPSFNYGRFLPTAIDSVLDQSYSNFELLVVDNRRGGRELRDRPRVRPTRRSAGPAALAGAGEEDHEDRGVNASLNLGLEEARGVYFGLLPADDLYPPDSLARRAASLTAEPGVAFVYGTAEFVDETGAPMGQIGGRSPEKMLESDGTADLLQALLLHNFVPGGSLLAATSELRAVGGFDRDVYFNDWYVAIRLLARGVGHLSERIRSSATGTTRVTVRRNNAKPIVRASWSCSRSAGRHSESAGDRLGAPRTRSLIALQRALHADRLGEREEARAAIAAAMSVDPTLRGDAAYVSWWLNVRHGEWSLALSGGERSSFLSALTSSSTPLEAVLDTGSGYAAFAAFFVVSAGETLTIQVRERILWTVVAEQLEAVGAGLQPAVLISLLLRGMRQPHLFRVRSFVKAILCAAGAWRLGVAARRWRTTIGRR